MTFSIPQPIQQLAGGNLPIFPANALENPAEGRFIIPVELDWPGTGATFQINVQGRTTQPFSRIAMLDVDNSQSGADVTFYFPDTTDTLVVPAYSAGTFPVFTNGLTFYASAPAALVSDVTRLRILNYLQFPLANPSPQFHDVAAVASGNVVSGTTAIIASTIYGTLVGYSIFAGAQGGSTASYLEIQLKDHTSGQVIDGSEITESDSVSFNGLVANVADIAYRFAGGIDLVLTASGTAWGAGNVFANCRYRTP
jgi:hypothetical protein